MSIKHLSDYDIQEYLDNNKTDNTTTEHVVSCAECEMMLNEYEEFYTILKADEEPELSPKFSENIMAVIKSDPSFNESSIGFYLYSFFGVLISVVTTGYLVGYDAMLQAIGVNSLAQFLSDMTIVQSFKNLFVGSMELIEVVLFAAAIILFFSLIERMMMKQKVGKISCFSI